jgi:hypothetical protein
MMLGRIAEQNKKGSTYASKPLTSLERETGLEPVFFVATERLYGRPDVTWMLKNTAKYPS